MFAMTNEKGQAMAFPDVCKTPMPPVGEPVPIPYPNEATMIEANIATCSRNVYVCGAKALTLRSQIMSSQGDDPGVELGIISEMVMGPMGFTMGSEQVFINGAPAVFLDSLTKHNGEAPNAEGATISPSQTKVTVGM